MPEEDQQPLPGAPRKQRVWPLLVVILLQLVCIAGFILFFLFGPKGFMDWQNAGNRRSERKEVRIQEIAGTYVNSENQGYITLKADGSYDYSCPNWITSRPSQAGLKWEMKSENQLFVPSISQERGYSMFLQGNILSDGDSRWARQ